MTATLQREPWNGQPTYLGDLFRVSKTRGDKTLDAVGKLWTHAVGWSCVWRSTAISTVGDLPLRG